MSTTIIDYFNYEYRKGYCRFFDEGQCFYIPEQDMKKLLIDDLQNASRTA